MIRPTDLAWAAGLIDGEGCVRISRSRHTVTRRWYYGVDLRVRMTSKSAIERLHALFGGKVSTIEGLTQAGKKQIWSWRVGASDTKRVLLMVRPYLVVKGEEADLVLKAADRTRLTGSNQNKQFKESCWLEIEGLFQQCKALKRKAA